MISLRSKYNLQETILGLADFYKNFSNIYFPLRLDSRGRIYCSSSYLHYQSTELAKALLLFAKPGVISKKNLDDTKFLEFYGVNCFGKDKLSDHFKRKWIRDNIVDILDYDNGILLNKAKNKFLFFAWSINVIMNF